MSGNTHSGFGLNQPSGPKHIPLSDTEDTFDPGGDDIGQIGPDIDPANEPADPLLPDQDLPSADQKPPFGDPSTDDTVISTTKRISFTEHPDGSAPPLTRLVESSNVETSQEDKLIWPIPPQ